MFSSKSKNIQLLARRPNLLHWKEMGSDGGWQGGRMSIDFFFFLLWMELEFLEPAGAGLR